MAFSDSDRSKFLLDDTGGTQRDLSAYITEIDGLPGARYLRETTGMADQGWVFLPTAEDARFVLRGLYDDAASSGPDAVLGPLGAHGSAVDFEFAPTGTASGSIKYSGVCWVEVYELRSRVGRLVEWTAHLRADGLVARGAY